MTDGDILEAIGKVARTHLGWTGQLSRDMALVETLDLDSIRLLTLVVEVENCFRVRLDDEDEGRLVTVGDVVDVIRRKLAAGTANDR